MNIDNLYKEITSPRLWVIMRLLRVLDVAVRHISTSVIEQGRKGLPRAQTEEYYKCVNWMHQYVGHNTYYSMWRALEAEAKAEAPKFTGPALPITDPVRVFLDEVTPKPDASLMKAASEMLLSPRKSDEAFAARLIADYGRPLPFGKFESGFRTKLGAWCYLSDVMGSATRPPTGDHRG